MMALLTRKQLSGARELARTDKGRAHVALTLATIETMWCMHNRILALVPATPGDIEEKLRLELNARALASILSEVQA